jgi:hypothetical protein
MIPLSLVDQAFFKAVLRIVEFYFFNDLDELRVVVKVDAKVIGDRREVFICQLYNTVSNDVLLAFLDLWEKLGDLVVEKTA